MRSGYEPRFTIGLPMNTFERSRWMRDISSRQAAAEIEFMTSTDGDGSGTLAGLRRKTNGGAIRNLSAIQEIAGFLVIAAILGPIAVFGLYAVINVAWSAFSDDSWLSRIEVGGLALVLGFFAFWVREKKRPFAYPMLEICAGVLIAGQAVHVEKDPLVSLLALVAAVRLIVDGIKRTEDYRQQRKLARQTIAAPN
jgi:hypothetical protein